MIDTLDASHDPARTSWVASANGHADFPIQNLPFGATREEIVVAIGDYALPLAAALELGIAADSLMSPVDATRPPLNDAMTRYPPEVWTRLRRSLSHALAETAWRSRLEPLLRPIRSLTLAPVAATPNYTDFYASLHHATNVGAMFRPDNPLLPNYKWIPIGYHGRASTIVIDGTPIRRPNGQTRAPDHSAPTVGPSKSLDYELEIGLVLGGSNSIGEAVPASQAMQRIFGVVLLNDWSARDLQSWEYQPLGPFLAKSFATTVSPWLVTRDALLPYEVAMPARPAGDPAPLDYLRIPDERTWSLDLSVQLQTAAMRQHGDAAIQLSAVQFGEAMYWSPAQLVTHHASNGCALLAGDLLGSGTISGTTRESNGCLLERTRRGAEPLILPDGTKRSFLEDGDEVIITGHAVAPGRPAIGFGTCRGVVLPA